MRIVFDLCTESKMSTATTVVSILSCVTAEQPQQNTYNDDHQYTAWGDGWGFAVSGTKKSLGVSRVSGLKSSYSGTDLWSGDGKSYGIICINSILYMWVGPGSGVTSYDEARLYKSTNHGLGWSATSVEFVKADDIIMPTILNFGQNYAGARDNYVYHYFIDLVGNPSSLAVHIPGKIYLLRVDKSHIEDETYYEFFSGTAASPAWSSSIGSRTTVFERTQPASAGTCRSATTPPSVDTFFAQSTHRLSRGASVCSTPRNPGGHGRRYYTRITSTQVQVTRASSGTSPTNG